jgi:hypothetical protein
MSRGKCKHKVQAHLLKLMGNKMISAYGEEDRGKGVITYTSQVNELILEKVMLKGRD